MPITGQKMRSSYVDHPKLDGDLWLGSRDEQVTATVRRHDGDDGYVETLIWDHGQPADRRVTSIILVRATGKTFSARTSSSR